MNKGALFNAALGAIAKCDYLVLSGIRNTYIFRCTYVGMCKNKTDKLSIFLAKYETK